jgi:hypothetical protein
MAPSNPNFTTVSDQEDEQGRDVESFNIDGNEQEYNQEGSRTRYVYIRPMLKYVLAGVALVISAAIFVSVIGGTSSSSSEWKPSPVDPKNIESYLDNSRFLETIEFNDVTGLKSGMYLQKSTMVSENKISVMGEDVSSHTDLELDSTMSVNDLNDGGKEISVTVTGLKMDVSSMGVEQHYDSNEEHEDNEVSKIMDSLIGEPTVIKVDNNDNIIQAGESDATANLQISHSDQYSQISRAAEALPPSDQLVQPSDNWDFDGMNMNGFAFSGSSSLLGYTNYDGHDVAVIKFEGAFDIDYQEIMDGLVDDDKLNEVMSGLMVKDGQMTGWIYWDKDSSFARWSYTEMSMTMEMKNPMGGDDEFIDIPSTIQSESYVTLA